jgi:hypothetical protein
MGAAHNFASNPQQRTLCMRPIDLAWMKDRILPIKKTKKPLLVFPKAASKSWSG